MRIITSDTYKLSKKNANLPFPMCIEAKPKFTGILPFVFIIYWSINNYNNETPDEYYFYKLNTSSSK